MLHIVAFVQEGLTIFHIITKLSVNKQKRLYNELRVLMSRKKKAQQFRRKIPRAAEDTLFYTPLRLRHALSFCQHVSFILRKYLKVFAAKTLIIHYHL